MTVGDSIAELRDLTEKIRENTASVLDYDKYENILMNSKLFSKEEIDQYLKNAHLASYNDLIQARKNAKTFEDRKALEGVVVVGLVALGLALILNEATRSR